MSPGAFMTHNLAPYCGKLRAHFQTVSIVDDISSSRRKSKIHIPPTVL